MGKRSSQNVKSTYKKVNLDTIFDCVFCSQATVTVNIDKKIGKGYLQCKSCGQKFDSPINPLTVALDIYHDWRDTCYAVADAAELAQRLRAAEQAIQAKALEKKSKAKLYKTPTATVNVFTMKSSAPAPKPARNSRLGGTSQPKIRASFKRKQDFGPISEEAPWPENTKKVKTEKVETIIKAPKLPSRTQAARKRREAELGAEKQLLTPLQQVKPVQIKTEEPTATSTIPLKQENLKSVFTKHVKIEELSTTQYEPVSPTALLGEFENPFGPSPPTPGVPVDATEHASEVPTTQDTTESTTAVCTRGPLCDGEDCDIHDLIEDPPTPVATTFEAEQVRVSKAH